MGDHYLLVFQGLAHVGTGEDEVEVGEDLVDEEDSEEEEVRKSIQCSPLYYHNMHTVSRITFYSNKVNYKI